MRARLRPEEALLFIYGAALVLLMAITRRWYFTAFQHPRFLEGFVALALLVFVREAQRARGRPEWWRAAARPAFEVLRDFFPFFLGLLFYETLHDLTPILRPSVVDARLIAADRALFGVDAAQWLGRFASPALTHVMIDCYLSYFFAPIALATILYWRGQRAQFREYMVSLCVVTVLGYCGYLLVPAVGPYVFEAARFPTRLPGGEKTHFFIAQIDSLKGVARDCFPSMHTAHTTVVLAFAWRFARRWFWLYLPIALGLYVSTVYLRMHYVVDVIAGLAVSALAVAIGPRLERWWMGAPAAAAPLPATATA
ncbi:MAG TPA: phosphatase PAP2 family protein [Polyangia bacterium]